MSGNDQREEVEQETGEEDQASDDSDSSPLPSDWNDSYSSWGGGFASRKRKPLNPSRRVHCSRRWLWRGFPISAYKKKCRDANPKLKKAEIWQMMMENLEQLREADEARRKRKWKKHWDYDSRDLPKEFVDLDSETFVVDPAQPNICFFPTDILAMICKNLSVFDFIEVSLTCRFLHWRMFTSCKCYAPYTVYMEVAENEVGFFDDADDLPVDIKYMGGEYRGVFTDRPICLNGPFYFLQIDLFLYDILKKNVDFDRFQKYIVAVRKYAKILKIISESHTADDEDPPFYSNPKMNDFLQSVNASWFVSENDKVDDHLWQTCPHTRQMEFVNVPDANYEANPAVYEIIPWTSCPNPIGFYVNPPKDVVWKTLNDIFSSFMDIKFHYYHFRSDYGLPNLILERLFAQHNFEEYAVVLDPSWQDPQPEHVNLWYGLVSTNGQVYKMRITRCERFVGIAIALVNLFDDMEDKYSRSWRLRFPEPPAYDGNAKLDKPRLVTKWRMETAVEPEDG